MLIKIFNEFTLQYIAACNELFLLTQTRLSIQNLREIIHINCSFHLYRSIGYTYFLLSLLPAQ